MTDPSTAPGDASGLAASGQSRLVPSWLENLAELSWRVLVVVALVVVLWFMATYIWTVTASIAVAIVVAAVFAPAVLRLRDRGRSRNAAAGIVWAIAILTVGAVLLILVVAFLPYVADLASRLAAGSSQFQAQMDDLQLPSWLSGLLQDAISEAQAAGGSAVSAIVGSVAGVVTVLILATFLVFFFLRDGDKAWLWIFQSLGPGKLEQITSAGDDALSRVGGYLRGTTVLAAIMAISAYVFMVLLGVPLALPLAILTFAATYIPYVGGYISTAAILLVTYGSLGSGPTIVMMVLVGLRGAAISYFIRPAIYRRTVSIHPALVLIVLPAGFQLGGMFGLFAAVPITAVVLTVARAAQSLMEPDTPPPLPEIVPAWLDHAAQWGWRLLLAIALIAALVLILTTIPLVILPVVLALVFAATLDPIVGALMRRGRSRGAATGIAVVATTVAIVGIMALSLVSLVEQADLLGGTAMAGADKLNQSADGTLTMARDALQSGTGSMVQAITGIADALAAAGAVTILSILLTFYFLRDGEHLWRRLVTHTHSDAADKLSAAGSRAFGVLGGYMIGTAAISLVGAASQAVIMWMLGLPLVLPVFVLSFFAAFIPYIGGAITTMLAFLIAVSVGSAFDVLVMGIWTVVFNLVQGNVVAPLVYGRTTHIHPAVVLVSIPAGAAVAGILGMFIVVPAIGVVATTWRTVLSVMASETDGQANPPGPSSTPTADQDDGDAGPGILPAPT